MISNHKKDEEAIFCFISVTFSLMLKHIWMLQWICVIREFAIIWTFLENLQNPWMDQGIWDFPKVSFGVR